MNRRLPILAALLVAPVLGCGGKPAPVGRRPGPGPAGRPATVVSRDKILASACSVLDRLDDFDDARGIELVFDRLNQWARLVPENAAADWRPDPLLAELPERYSREFAQLEPAAAGFLLGDTIYLRDQRWLADIARVARGEARDDLDVARALFAWTVRSLALVGDPPQAPTEANPGARWFQPGEILLSGRASGPQRAWIFLELLRHAGIDGVMLATGGAPESPLRGWVPAVLAGGSLHLFDPVYGMPVPGPGGEGVATLAEAVADPEVLAAMSLPERPYPVQAENLARITVLVAATPWGLTRRMHLLDPETRGAREMHVAVEASRLGAEAAAAVRAAGAESGGPRLWDFPWETLARRREDMPRIGPALADDLGPLEAPGIRTSGIRTRADEPLDDSGRDGSGRKKELIAPTETARRETRRPLWEARVREFRGEFAGPQGAKSAYLEARRPRAEIDRALAELPPDQAERARLIFARIKEDAAYWLGILTLAEGDPQTTVDYLGRMILEGSPDSRWTDAARTNLAEALVELGRTADAIKWLEADESPQRFGSRLRARRLAE